MMIGKPAPFVSAFVDAVNEVIRVQHAGGGMSAMQRTGLALCGTAVLITHAIGWARFERARLGTDALAALSWMFRHRKIPWDELLVAGVRGMLRHDGLTCGRRVMDDPDNPRAQAAQARASRYTRRDNESRG
jgi:hypothetical protein